MQTLILLYALNSISPVPKWLIIAAWVLFAVQSALEIFDAIYKKKGVG